MVVQRGLNSNHSKRHHELVSIKLLLLLSSSSVKLCMKFMRFMGWSVLSFVFKFYVHERLLEKLKFYESLLVLFKDKDEHE